MKNTEVSVNTTSVPAIQSGPDWKTLQPCWGSESPGRVRLQERLMEGGSSDTGRLVVTDTEKTEPLLTVVLIRSPASGLKQKF